MKNLIFRKENLTLVIWIIMNVRFSFLYLKIDDCFEDIGNLNIFFLRLQTETGPLISIITPERLNYYMN